MRSISEELAVNGRLHIVRPGRIGSEKGHRFDDQDVTGPYDPDPSWRWDAACLDVDPDLFFPNRGGGGTTGEASSGREVRDLCFSCPVRLSCLHYAIVPWVPKIGWWGGHPLEERRRVRKLLSEGWTLEAASKKVAKDSGVNGQPSRPRG